MASPAPGSSRPPRSCRHLCSAANPTSQPTLLCQRHCCDKDTGSQTHRWPGSLPRGHRRPAPHPATQSRLRHSHRPPPVLRQPHQPALCRTHLGLTGTVQRSRSNRLSGVAGRRWSGRSCRDVGHQEPKKSRTRGASCQIRSANGCCQRTSTEGHLETSRSLLERPVGLMAWLAPPGSRRAEKADCSS